MNSVSITGLLFVTQIRNFTNSKKKLMKLHFNYELLITAVNMISISSLTIHS